MKSSYKAALNKVSFIAVFAIKVFFVCYFLKKKGKGNYGIYYRGNNGK